MLGLGWINNTAIRSIPRFDREILDMWKNLKLIWRALCHPEPAPTDVSLTRRILAMPRLFDMVSAVMQLKQSQRISDLPEPDPSDDSPRARTIRHNQKMIRSKPVTRTRRVEAFYQVATMPYRDVGKESVLVVGARAIHEFYEATLYGFDWDNLTGVDLFSAHPKILEMDMHALAFPDNHFDVVMMVNTLGYSTQPAKAIAEAIRVLTPGGRFVFNHAYRGIGDQFSRTATIPAREIYAMIVAAGGRLFFYDADDKTNAATQRQTSHIFGVRKRPIVDALLDEFTP